MRPGWITYAIRVTSLVALLAVAEGVKAQQPDTAVAGQRIKLLLTADTVGGHPRQLLFGTLLNKTADSLRLDLGTGVAPLNVSTRAIDGIFVSRGVPTRKQSATGGAIGGAVVGAGVGLLMILFTDADVLDLLGHVTFDAAAGAAIGALLPQESWRRVNR
jgi:hypothetical protein